MQPNFGIITQFSSEPTKFQGESVILSSHTGNTDSILFDNYDTGVLPPLGPFSSNTLADQVPVFQVFCFRGKTVDLLKVESFEMSRLNIRYVIRVVSSQ